MQPLPCPAGRIRVRGIGGGHKRRYRMIDFQRLRYEDGASQESFSEKVINVRYDPCRQVRGAGSAPGPRDRARGEPCPAWVPGAGRLTLLWWPVVTVSAGSLLRRTCSQGTSSRTPLTSAGWQVHAGARGGRDGSLTAPCSDYQPLSSSVSQRRGCLSAGGFACGHTDLQPGEPPWEGRTVHPGSW